LPGGQAGSSSRIENYLGFPAGIYGLELTGRAYAQAQKFGAQVMVTTGAAKLACVKPPYAVQLEDGGRINARAMIIASGARYRKPSIANVTQFEGAGVYYSASRMESQLCAGAVPNTGWLDGCVTLDGRGFIKTGPDLSPEDLTTGGWPLARSPYLLETNRPGVFAVGDVRGGNIKRVASAVGEGSIAVAFVHR